jgi:uncharacterized membrane protein
MKYLNDDDSKKKEFDRNTLFDIDKNRMEAFSDAIIAIIMTVMVLELPFPKTASYEEIRSFGIAIFVFFDSFFIVGSYWYKHCVLFKKIEKVSQKLVWRNLLFLFVISLVPIFTKWVIADFGKVLPAIAYISLYVILGRCFLFLFLSETEYKQDKELSRIMLLKNIILVVILILAVILASFFPYIASILFIGIPLMNAIGNIWIENDGGRHRREKIQSHIIQTK